MRVLPAAALCLTLVLALKVAGVATVFDAGTARAEDKAGAPPAAPAAEKADKPADHPSEATTQGQTASEADVLESLAQRREQLDERERQLDMREKVAAAAEKRVEERITDLKDIEAKVEAMFAQRDDAQKAQVASLVKTYEAMKPADAAKIFNTLNRDVLLDVVMGMKPAKVAPVLAAMQPDKAQEVTVAIAQRLALPKTADGSAAPAEGLKSPGAAVPESTTQPAQPAPEAKPAAPAAKPGA